MVSALWFTFHVPPFQPYFLELGCNWHYLKHMLKTWVWTSWSKYLRLRFTSSGVSAFVWPNQISASFFYRHCFLCWQFLSFDSLTGWKVPELWGKNGLLLCPLAVTVDLIVSEGNMGLGCNHLHTATPADWHSFWRSSQMLLQVLRGLRQSERVIDCVFLKGWAALRPSVKVGHHLRRFLSCWAARRQWRKGTEFKLWFAESLPKQVKLSNALPGEKSYLVKNLILGQRFMALKGISFVEFLFRLQYYKKKAFIFDMTIFWYIYSHFK